VSVCLDKGPIKLESLLAEPGVLTLTLNPRTISRISLLKQLAHLQEMKACVEAWLLCKIVSVESCSDQAPVEMIRSPSLNDI
jgi:hypothetical protein